MIEGCQRARRRRRCGRRLHLESLEPRVVLDAEGVAWSVSDLTLSFAPDGTEVAGESSKLVENMDSLADRDLWQQAILRGFHTWTQHLDASVTAVSDNGAQFGTSGPTQGDTRFGDVRVAAIPMAGDVLAISIPHDEVISGTWAGDVLFNANAVFESIDDLFAVAVHEAGHVLGLGHSLDPASPMAQHGIPTSVIPTPGDIRDLRKLYGTPGVDDDSPSSGSDAGVGSGEQREAEHEAEHANDRLETADAIVLSPRFAGAIRYDAGGRIASSDDADVYQLPPLADGGSAGEVLTVIVRDLEGTLAPKAELFDSLGNPLESDVLRNANGQFVMQVEELHLQQPHFVRITGGHAGPSSETGDYEMVATFSPRRVKLTELAEGKLTAERPEQTSALEVPETQLVHFVLETEANALDPALPMWVVVYDEQGRPVFRTATRGTDVGTADAVLLSPGTYRVELHSGASSDPARELEYKLLSKSVSLPIGPSLVDPTNNPVRPCGTTGAAAASCTTPDVVATDPIILPGPLPRPLPAPTVVVSAPAADSGFWYWERPVTRPTPPPAVPARPDTGSAASGAGTPVNSPPLATSPATTSPTDTPLNGTVSAWQNRANPSDVNADSLVAPVDVLMVVNYLNSGKAKNLAEVHPPNSPFVDVNSDRLVSPVDALIVINRINLQVDSGGGEGEGWGGMSFAVAEPGPAITDDGAREAADLNATAGSAAEFAAGELVAAGPLRQLGRTASASASAVSVTAPLTEREVAALFAAFAGDDLVREWLV